MKAVKLSHPVPLRRSARKGYKIPAVSCRTLGVTVAMTLVAIVGGSAAGCRAPASSEGDVASGASVADTRKARIRGDLLAELQPVKLANCELERFGEPADGGYLVCGNLLAAVESAYSYGISGYDQWGCDVSRRLDVTVHEYDCFDTREPSCPGGALAFHAECIGTVPGVQDGRPFDTLRNQIARNGDATKRLVVKMDVEGAEWDALLLASDEVLQRIDQLTVEFHHVEEERFVAAVRRLKQFFYVANLHFNNFSCDPSLAPFPSWAYEALFVSKKLGVLDPSGAAAGPSAADAPNNPAAPDCQEVR